MGGEGGEGEGGGKGREGGGRTTIHLATAFVLFRMKGKSRYFPKLSRLVFSEVVEKYLSVDVKLFEPYRNVFDFVQRRLLVNVVEPESYRVLFSMNEWSILLVALA